MLLMAPAATPYPRLEVVPPHQLSRHLGRLLVGLVPFFLRYRRDNQSQIFVPALRVPSLGSSYLFAFQGKGLAVRRSIFPLAPNERAVKPRSWRWGSCVAIPSSAFPKPECHDNVKDRADGDGLGSPKIGVTAIVAEMVKALVV